MVNWSHIIIITCFLFNQLLVGKADVIYVLEVQVMAEGNEEDVASVVSEFESQERAQGAHFRQQFLFIFTSVSSRPPPHAVR